jgi:hypothetical protein
MSPVPWRIKGEEAGGCNCAWGCPCPGARARAKRIDRGLAGSGDGSGDQGRILNPRGLSGVHAAGVL